MARITAAERDDRFDELISSAASCSDADRRLAAMLADPAIGPGGQTRVAAKLGHVPSGPAGRAALRAAFAEATEKYVAASKSAKPGYSDLICACLWALAERDGPAATDILAAAASSSSPHVRASAIGDLAVAGDDRAWEAVMARLTAMLRRRSGPYGVAWHTSCSAIEYLARHAPRGSDRAIRLINLLRDRWHNLADPELINRWWPAIPAREPAATIDFLAPDRPRAWWEAACGSRDFRMAVLPATLHDRASPSQD